MASVTPLRISLPSTLALRSLISKSDNFSSVSFHFICAVACRLGHPGRPGDRRSQEPLVHLLLVQTGQPGAGGDVLDGAVAVADPGPARPQRHPPGPVPGLPRRLAPAAAARPTSL